MVLVFGRAGSRDLALPVLVEAVGRLVKDEQTGCGPGGTRGRARTLDAIGKRAAQTKSTKQLQEGQVSTFYALEAKA